MKTLIFLALALLQSCSWSESDYTKIMNPIQKLKLSEKASGKKSPVYNGIIEPDFPDQKENNKTIDGVDSNHDGVRDDIEIWINRTADDDYVRIEMKQLYTTSLAVHKSVWNDEPIEIQSQKSFEYSEALSCLGEVLKPFEKSYLEKKIERNRMLSDLLYELTYNTPARKELVAKINSFQGHEQGGRGGDFSHCDKRIDQKYFEELKSKYSKEWPH